LSWPGQAPLRRRWDLTVLAVLAGRARRPADLIQAINSQAPDGRNVSWKVLNETLRRLEASGHVARRQMPGVPRETWYWLCPPGQRLICALTVLDHWYRYHGLHDGQGWQSRGGKRG
jgi:DNA-binding HxlR family transcriptional regulator